MKNLKDMLQNNFVKSVLLITGGTAFAQVINAALSPVITRMYTPKEYGVLTVYISILGMLAIVGSLKYEWGIAIAEDDEKAINVLSLSICILFLVTIMITVILVVFGDALLSLFDGTVLSKYKLFIPLGVFFTGLYNIFTQWALRKKDYKSISKTKLSQSITQNIIKISLGLLKVGPAGLILGNIFGQSAGNTTLSMPLFKKDKNLIKKITGKSMLWSAKRYKRFPLYSAPGQFLNTAGIQLPVLFITSLYGSGVIGLYGLANTIVNIPMNLIGNSIADVFYGETTRIGRSNPQRIKDLSLNLLKKSILIGLIPLITLLLFGPFLFSFVFGQNWYQAGVYARIISVLIFARLIFTPITRIFFVFERQKEFLFLDVFRISLVLIVFYISKVLSLNSYWAIGLYASAMSVVYLITYVYAQKVINEEIEKIKQ